MNIKRFSGLLILFLGIIVLSACNSNTESEENGEEKETLTYENTYDLRLGDGPDSDTEAVTETFELPKNSDKVAILELGVASTFEALGLEDNIVGISKGDNNSSLGEELSVYEDDKYENLGGLKEPDFEKIAELDPDIIMIGGRQTNQDTIDEFEKAAPNAEIIPVQADETSYFEDIKETTNLIGQLYDKEDEAQELNDDLDDKLADVQNDIDNLDETMMFIQTSGGDLSLHGPGGRYDFLYNPIGFEASGEEPEEEDTSNHGNQISYEYISEQNPGLILVMDRGAAISNGEDATKVDTIKTDVTEDVDAVKNDNIYELNGVRWYLNSGGHATAMSQLEELKDIVDQAETKEK